MNLLKRNIVVVLFLFSFGCSFRETTGESAQRIFFLGDSITELGVKPNGYVTIVRDSLKTMGYNFTVIGAGVSGNKVSDLQKRLQDDVLKKNPSVVVIYIGINDVWHFEFTSRGLSGTPKRDFEKGLKEIIIRIKNSGARVILCTPSVIGEKSDGSNKYDSMLDEYSTISKNVASESSVPICDLRSAFVDYLKKNNLANVEKNILTYDGVHLNDDGNKFVAGQMLAALDGLGLFFPQK